MQPDSKCGLFLGAQTHLVTKNRAANVRGATSPPTPCFHGSALLL